ncbi:hypothetical protein BH23ACI1_BH23ACI1_09100 [soil metagenome]
MGGSHRDGDAVSPRERLLHVIGGVRRRWRAKIALRGLLITCGAALLFALTLSWLAHRSDVANGTLLTLALVALITIAGLGVRYLAMPLRRRVSNEQVALYLEEHEATLQATLITALETDAGTLSPAFAERTLEQAIEKCRAIEYGRRVDRAELNRFATAFSAIAVVGIGMSLFGPGILRSGAEAVLSPLRGGERGLRIEVEPGNATIPRGADQIVTAHLRGWEQLAGAPGVAQQVEILMRAVGDSVFQRIPLTVTETSTSYEVLLFDVDRATEYFVEADGVRTPLYRIEVADLPYVERLDLEYRYPDYTGLPPETFEEAGDIVALHGTAVTVRATTTMPVAGGRILLDDGRRIEMTVRSDGVLEGRIRVEREGFYSIELTTPEGAALSGSPRYHIDVITDRGPSVRISRPGRDTRPTTIEEVFVEVTAEDDFGVARLELVYAVNGGQERTIPLLAAARPLPEIAAGHTFYLEEIELQPGDLISYYARATDNATPSPTTATSDIFFMNIRPFGRDYRQADQPPGGEGGQQGQGEDAGDLSRRQREIITATFNLLRDSAVYSAKDYAEHVNTITLMQERLREQVLTLHGRMENRQVTQDSMFARIAAILPEAAKEMAAALGSLRGGKARDAMPAEQRALLHLQRAEALYRDVQVAQQQGGGGGGGGGAPNAEDLADLFELERDALRNQYETVQRGERQQQNQGQAEVDAALERLRELARRQEQENERLRRQAQMRQSQQGGGGSAQGQRDLAEETEQTARQLERLARETQQQSLSDVARQLQQAADAMRRSATNTRSGTTADASAALDQLEQARRRLERSRNESLEQQARGAVAQAGRLAREQREIAQRMERLHDLTGAERSAEARRLIERKEQQAAEVADLERQLDRLAASARSEQQREASRRLQESANAIRENQLKERISWSRNFAVSPAPSELGRSTEQLIGEHLQDVEQRATRAAAALGESPGQRAEETLDRLRRLARGLESMQERTALAEEQARQGQQGQQGQQAQGAQGGQGGRNDGERTQGGRGGDGDTTGTSRDDAGGLGDRRPGRLTADDIRQLRGEVRQRTTEAERLRRLVQGEPVDQKELENILRGLRALDDDRVYQDASELARLQSAVMEGLKRFEFNLRRQAHMRGSEVFLTGAEDVPEEFRKLVEEYYKSLSRNPRKP